MLEVTESSAGQRVDNYLFVKLKGVPKSRVYRAIRKGEVRVNGGRVKTSYSLCLGDLVRVPPLRVSEPKQASNVPSDFIETLKIIYEDSSILVVDKPSGLAVHGGTNLSYGLIEALRAKLENCLYLELVHRLDRETSGCVVLAKKRSSLLALQQQFEQREVRKKYLAFVSGAMHTPKWVNIGIKQKDDVNNKVKMHCCEDGFQAKSYIKPLASYGNATLVEIDLHTGRTHQARLHCAYLGHPIAGDYLYGLSEFNKSVRTHSLKRMFLHAEFISFSHPETKKTIILLSKMPLELESFLDKYSKVKNI